VQRLFSMFPAGWPGVALLLLRASVAIALLLESLAHRHGLSVWIAGASLLAGAALCAGLFTPIAAAVVLGLHVWIWWTLSVGPMASATVISLDALALSLLGPGAYSIDSRRFGRHVVILPPR
jgi:uncharacterized membrane protein YphA (DoxX/SURF4 family)